MQAQINAAEKLDIKVIYINANHQTLKPQRTNTPLHLNFADHIKAAAQLIFLLCNIILQKQEHKTAQKKYINGSINLHSTAILCAGQDLNGVTMKIYNTYLY